jgi:DNA repair exonuclease SbcCD nuclease subunit
VKLLAFSDIHLDAVTAGRTRRGEVLTFLQEVCHLAETNRVDTIIFGGDAHDPGRLFDPLFSADLIRYFTAFGGISSKPKVVAIAGNHDVVDSSELFLSQPITSLTPLRAAVQCMPRDIAERFFILDRPHARRIADDWAVLGLPYVSRAHAKIQPHWENHAFASAAQFRKQGCRLVVVGHRVVPEAQISSETVEMARGQDQLFPFERVEELEPACVINGHYHSRQIVNHGKLSIGVPGSPVRFTFGEAEQTDKGVLLAEFV